MKETIGEYDVGGTQSVCSFIMGSLYSFIMVQKEPHSMLLMPSVWVNKLS